MMFVHARFQGRGVATALLRQVEAAALEAGLSRVFTEASITARPFFLSRGFELIAEQTVECEGQWLTNFRMHKRLARDQNSFICPSGFGAVGRGGGALRSIRVGSSTK